MTVALTGDIDLATAPSTLQAILAAAVAAEGGMVVVDFTNVDFVDAAAVNMLVSARNQLNPRATSIMVRSPPEMLTRMLDMFDLDDLIEHPSPSSALGGSKPDHTGTGLA